MHPSLLTESLRHPILEHRPQFLPHRVEHDPVAPRGRDECRRHGTIPYLAKAVRSSDATNGSFLLLATSVHPLGTFRCRSRHSRGNVYADEQTRLFCRRQASMIASRLPRIASSWRREAVVGTEFQDDDAGPVFLERGLDSVAAASVVSPLMLALATL